MANSYGFLTHPQLTFNKLRRDRSQMAIFGSLWLGGWLGILAIAGLGFLISWFFPPFNWVKKLGLGISFIGAIFLLFFTVYLVYWIVIFFQRRNA